MANTVDITLQLKKQGNALDKIDKELKGLNKSLDKTEKEAKEAGKAVDNVGKEGSKNIDKIGTSFSGLGVAIGASTVALGAFLASVAANNKELKQLATLSGLSLEEFQKFALAAELAGANADQTADALNDLSLKINEALVLGGGAAVDVFRKLGLSLEEVQKLSPDKQFEALAAALQNVDKQQQKLFLDELASDALIQLLPLIEGYEEFTGMAEQFASNGGIISQEDIDKTEQLTQSFTLLNKQVQTSGTKALGVFSDEFTPVIQELTKYMQELTKETESGFSQVAIEAARLASIIKVVINSISILINGIQVWGEIALEVFRNVSEAFKNVLDGNFEDISFSFDMTGLNSQIKDIEENFKALGPAIAGTVAPELKIIKNEMDEINKSIKTFNDGLSAGDRLDAVLDLEKQLDSLKLKLDSVFESDKDNALYKTFSKQLDQIYDEIPSKIGGVISDTEVKVNVKPVVSIDDFEKQYEAAQRGIKISKLEFELGLIGEEEFQKTFTDLTGQAQFALNNLINSGLDTKTIEEFELKLLGVVKQYDTLNNSLNKSKTSIDEYNKLILQGELDILKAQGQENLVLEKTLEQKIALINANDKLDTQQKQGLIDQEKQLAGIENSKIQISELQNEIANLNLNNEQGFINEEEMLKMDDLILKIKELEVAYGLAGEASLAASQKQVAATNEAADAQEQFNQEMAETFSDIAFNALTSTESITDSFKKMINDILAEMIKAQLNEFFLSAINSFGGGAGGAIGGFASLFHTGGLVGQEGFKRPISVPKYHTGGIAGLNPDEVPAVLQKGEEVLTASDPRHRNNGGGGQTQQVQINNLLDTNQIAQSLDGNQSFGDAIMNYMTANKNEVNNTLQN